MSGTVIHASVALVGERGVLIRGPSASGKSALLLALIAADPQRNALVADDQAIVAARHGRVTAAVPQTIAGLIEVRGQGIRRMAHVSPVVIDLIVDLVPGEASPRLPDEEGRHAMVAGVRLPRLALPVDCRDAAMRVGVALAVIAENSVNHIS